jgi:hypothetical protein
MNTLAGGLRPAREATDAIFDIFLAQVHYFDLGAGIAHALDELIEHQFGFTLASTTRAGINCEYSHAVLL